MAYSTRELYEQLCEEPARPSRRQAPAPRLRPAPPPPGEALAGVAGRLGVTVAVLTGRDRTEAVSQIRHAAMWLLYQRGLGTPTIGRLLGRDPTTVRYGILQVETARRDDPAARERLDRLAS
jgi:chromosomal replication initiation ATPase DnaA